jgi:hypothetical protein
VPHEGLVQRGDARRQRLVDAPARDDDAQRHPLGLQHAHDWHLDTFLDELLEPHRERSVR